MTRIIAITVLCLAFVLSARPAFAQPKAAQKLALLVGVKQYAHQNLPPLRYSENDVVAMAELLKQSGYDVVLLCDSLGAKDAALAPTKANIDKQLAHVLARC